MTRPDSFSINGNTEVIIYVDGLEVIIGDKDMMKMITTGSLMAMKKRELAIVMFTAGVAAMLNAFPKDLKIRVDSLYKHLKKGQ